MFRKLLDEGLVYTSGWTKNRSKRVEGGHKPKIAWIGWTLDGVRFAEEMWDELAEEGLE